MEDLPITLPLPVLMYLLFMYVVAEQSSRENRDTGEHPGPEDHPGAAAQRAYHCKGES